MEESHVHLQQNEQNSSEEPQAKPLNWWTKVEKLLATGSQVKFRSTEVVLISLIWTLLFLISEFHSMFLLDKLDKSKISEGQRLASGVVNIFLPLGGVAYLIFLGVFLFMPKAFKIWNVILHGIFVFLFLVLLSFAIFVIVPKAPKDLPSSPAPPVPALCPIPWVGYGERYYYLSAAEANWTHSQSDCSSQGGSLVTMETPEEKDFVQRYKEQIGYWIGARREGLSQPWRRLDESLFNNSFPIRGEGLCAYVNGRGFSSTWCANTRYWICSKQAH